jgi:hypothetical protein
MLLSQLADLDQLCFSPIYKPGGLSTPLKVILYNNKQQNQEQQELLSNHTTTAAH